MHARTIGAGLLACAAMLAPSVVEMYKTPPNVIALAKKPMSERGISFK